jgi:S1-C subfamily serine protease
VVIDPRGYGLTNYHVVQSFLETRRGVGGMSDGKLYPLHVLGVDPGGDVAMFKLSGKERFDAAPLGDSDELAVGQWVAAMGNPFLLAEDYTPTITLGIISGLHRYQEGQGNFLEYGDCIQVSTSINPGNSGGPLFDMQGRVIGINGRASFEERGRVNIGLGYAISVNQVKRFMPGLRAGRLVEHGTLGATLRDAGGELIVDAIQDFSAAEQAGLQLGDELLELSARRLATANDFNNVINTFPLNWPVTLRYRRFGVTYESRTRLERLPLAQQSPYLVDLGANHNEVNLLLSACRHWAGGPAEPLLAQATLRIGDEPARAITLRLALQENILDGPPRDESAALARELERILAVFHARIEVGLGWEHAGGDEVEGQVCAVVERRLEDQSRWQWKFDDVSGELREAVLLRGEDEAPIRWAPDDPRPLGALRAPARWRRFERGASDATVEIERVVPLAPGEGRP